MFFEALNRKVDYYLFRVVKVLSEIILKYYFYSRYNRSLKGQKRFWLVNRIIILTVDVGMNNILKYNIIDIV